MCFAGSSSIEQVFGNSIQHLPLSRIQKCRFGAGIPAPNTGACNAPIAVEIYSPPQRIVTSRRYSRYSQQCIIRCQSLDMAHSSASGLLLCNYKQVTIPNQGSSRTSTDIRPRITTALAHYLAILWWLC